MNEGKEGYFVHQFLVGPWDNFIYLIGDRASRRCAVVDPAWHADAIFERAAELDVTITDILCTHSHFDHVDQVEAVLAKVDARVHMLKAEIEFSGFSCENLVKASPGDTITIGEHLDITMMHTPGHTPGSVSYRLKDCIVTGDTLFVDGCGRCDFVGGDPETMFTTINTLVNGLPADTVMYPGHHYGPTASGKIGAQRQSNPFLKHTTVADFVKHRMDGKIAGSDLPPKPDWSPGPAA